MSRRRVHRCYRVAALLLRFLPGGALVSSAASPFLAPPALAAQADSIHVLWRRGDSIEPRTLPAGAHELRATSRLATPISAIALAADASRPFIVRFGAPPIAGARNGRVDLEATRAPYRRFLADLVGLEAATRAPRGDRAATYRLRRRLEVSFNGVAITASPALAERVRRLDYVTGVYPDDSVHARLDQSLAQIAVDSVRIALGATGSGIVVSIVDTGIDYGHPALGGCLGPSCRVIGGYDFVNGDADPIDDNGHGTHVAGIVGGNGSGLTGVAPGVRFLAFKALSASGGGLQSDVIAAIDRSLDPDRDPLTDDAADVVNLSLGGSGDADGPLCQAVDRAVAAGVVCVVAAGNAADYFTIEAPGSARRAITVGAVTGADQIASFSSRGPASPDDAIKPDVVAPGVGILSTWLGGGAVALSGTSMATPHVTGVAALLLELHRRWTPAAVKAALMNAAVDLGVDPFRQGAGRVDALAAATAGVTIEPASLSFGLAPTTAPAWAAVETLVVRNDSTRARSVSLATPSNLPAGSWCQVAPSSLSLAPGESRSILVTLSLDHAPNVANAPHAYSGALRADVDGRTLRVPFAVLRSPQLVLRTDDAGLVVVHDRAAFDLSLFASGSGARRLFVPAGTYDVIAALGSASRVVREGVVVGDSASVDLRVSDAVHAIERVCIDERGQALDLPIGIEYLRHRATGFGIVSIGSLPATMRFSTAGPAYEWEWHRLSYGQEPTTYDFKGWQRGIGASAVLRNAPGDLRHATLSFHPSPTLRQLLPVRWISDGPRGTPAGEGFAVSSIGTTGYLPPLESPFTQETYFLSTPDSNLHFKSRVHSGFPYQGAPFPAGVPDLETPYLVADPEQPVRGHVRGDVVHPVGTIAAGRLDIGLGPPTWFGSFHNRSDQLRVAPRFGDSDWMFLAQQGDWRDHAGMPYELSREGSPVESGATSGAMVRPLIPGRHTLTVTNDRYWIGDRRCRATVAASFDSRAADPDPPSIRDLACLVDGATANVLVAGAASVVSVVVEDAVALDSVTLAMRSSGAPAWSPLTVTRSGDRFEAPLATTLGGPLALRIEATDLTGNRVSYSIDPAVAIEGAADLVAPIVTLSSPNGGESWASGSRHDVRWTATDDHGVASVDLQLSTDGGGTFAALATGLPNNGGYDWLVPATIGGAARVKVVARDPSGNAAEDASNASFAITDGEPPVVTLLAPNGGESWTSGSTRSITWSATDNVAIAGVDLAYSTDQGATFPGAIATGVANTGSFTWTAPGAAEAMRVRIVARDAAGNAARDSSDADFAVVADSNRVSNGGFESSFTGWTAYGGAALSLANVGRNGARSLQMRGSSSSSFGCDDLPNWIATVAAKGAVYRVSAWVKTATGSRGTVRLRLYEYLGTSQQGSTAYSNSVALSAEWSLLTMDYVVRTAGSTLSLRVVDSPSAGGETFLVDDVSIKLLGGAPPDAAPIVSAPASASGFAGRAMTFLVNASDIDGPPIAALSPAGLPSTATFGVNASRTQGTFAWTPAASDVRTDPYAITFTASNSNSGSATTRLTVSAAPTNLCGNGDFESGTGGWGGYGNAALAAVAGGRTGKALQVAGSSSFGADDVPDWLPAPLAKGAVYRIACWVKRVGGSGSAGSVKIRVYEYLGSTQQGSTAYSPTATLTTSWQPLALDYTVRVAGTHLSIRITDAASSSESFLVDDVVIEPLGTGAASAAADASEGSALRNTAAFFAAAFVPNPARTEGVLTFTTTRTGFARIGLLDVNGREVRRLLDERRLEPGVHDLRVDRDAAKGGRLEAGVYFFWIRAEEGTIRGRIVFVQ